ncbi:hypothetical protein LINGRAPRIM_LOCUS3163 [Linum grandiflorum]
MIDKVPLAMIPNSFTVVQSLPISSSGKVDHSSLLISKGLTKHYLAEDGSSISNDLLHVIKKVCSIIFWIRLPYVSNSNFLGRPQLLFCMLLYRKCD